MIDYSQSKILGDPDVRKDLLGKIKLPHVKLLNQFVEKIRQEKGSDYYIPYFDPNDGGVNAKTLFLLEAPGPRAVRSEFVSRNNPDETARNILELLNEAGLSREETVLWNTVPWYIGSGKKIRGATEADVEGSLAYLKELLSILKDLRSIVLVGKVAQRVEVSIKDFSTLSVYKSPHPSPMFINRKLKNRALILKVFSTVNKSIK